MTTPNFGMASAKPEAAGYCTVCLKGLEDCDCGCETLVTYSTATFYIAAGYYTIPDLEYMLEAFKKQYAQQSDALAQSMRKI